MEEMNPPLSGGKSPHRVNNADIHERTIALENQVGNLGEKVQDISRSQARMAEDTRASFQQLEHQQRRSHETLEAMLSKSQEKLSSTIASRDVDQAGNKKFAIQIVVMTAGVCMTAIVFLTGGIVSVGWMSVRNLVDSTAVPMRADVNRLELAVGRNTQDVAAGAQERTTLKVQANTSEIERREIKERLSKNEEMIAKEMASRHSGFSALQQQLTEAERQHTMQDISRNLMIEHTHSLLAMLFEKMGLPKPSAPSYFPKIGREINTPIPNE